MDNRGPNIVFLDVDGVLNTNATRTRTPCGFVGVDRSHIKNLAVIVKKNAAEIVLTSTWKDGWNADKRLQTDMDADYLDRELRVYGLTIKDRTYDENFCRGAGIRNWLKDHPHGGWVVLDDEIFPDFEREGILPHLIRTSWKRRGGLLPDHIEQAAAILALPDDLPPAEGDGGEASGDKGFVHRGK